MRASNIERSDISFELVHLYAGSETFEKELIDGVRLAQRWFKCVEEFEQNKTLFSNVAFIDDYSSSGNKKVERSEIQSRVRDAFASAGLRLDYIAYEADCAETCRYIDINLSGPPKKGAGSYSSKRLRYDYVSPEEKFITHAKKRRGTSGRAPEYRNHVGIDIGVGTQSTDSGNLTEKIWSCPAAAAWWQMIRFGVLPHLEEEHELGAPKGTWKRDDENCPPFIARRTLSLLPSSYISIEHAVRVIIQNLHDLNAALYDKVRKGPKGPKDREMTALLNQMSYIFHD